MFSRLLGLGRSENQRIVDALYASIVASARRPQPYEEWNVPDTPLGRFEMLALHVILFLRRVRSADPAMGQLAQELTDEFFRDIDHSLRELGIGDLSVPKRMKKLARMFYGRVESYDAALEAGDDAALAEALRRNVRPDEVEWPEAGLLAAYVTHAMRGLSEQEDAAILAGRVDFPSVSREGANS